MPYPWATLSCSAVTDRKTATVIHVRQAAFEYIEVYYNRKRIQKALGYLSPSEFELGIDMTMALVA
jgi:putative transposase